MALFKKMATVAVSIFILWAVFHSLVIGMAKNGVVVDSVTKKPLEGIYLVRATYSYTSNLEGSYSDHPIIFDTTVTDKGGRFSFSPFVKIKLWLNKADQLYINSAPNYYALDGSSRTLKLNPGYFTDEYSSGFILPTGTTPNKPFNKYIDVNLIPIVSTLGECKDTSECLEKNKNYARACMMMPIRYQKDVCGEFSLKGTMIFKNDKTFGDDTSNDFAECNEKTDDISAALCFNRKQFEVGVMLSESTCSSLTYESARNLCYYIITINSPSNSLCDKITKKPFPDESLSYASDGVSNYKDLCIKERARMYNQ